MACNFQFPEIAYPGKLICPQYGTENKDGEDIIFNYVPGPGTKLIQYEHNGRTLEAITATLVGTVRCEEEKKLIRKKSVKALINLQKKKNQ